MMILITLLLRSGNPSRKRLWDGKDLTVLENGGGGRFEN